MDLSFYDFYLIYYEFYKFTLETNLENALEKEKDWWQPFQPGGLAWRCERAVASPAMAQGGGTCVRIALFAKEGSGFRLIKWSNRALLL